MSLGRRFNERWEAHIAWNASDMQALCLEHIGFPSDSVTFFEDHIVVELQSEGKSVSKCVVVFLRV